MSLPRKAGLTRKTPLKPGKPLARKAPPTRATAPVKTVTTSRRPANTSTRRARNTGPSMALRRAVHRRDRGRCIRCGAPATNIQHRRARGMGGSVDEDVNRLSCLLSVCGSGTTGCHGWIETNRTEARRLGYAVRRNARVDAERTPVLTIDGWQLFLDDGRRLSATPPPATETP